MKLLLTALAALTTSSVASAYEWRHEVPVGTQVLACETEVERGLIVADLTVGLPRSCAVTQTMKEDKVVEVHLDFDPIVHASGHINLQTTTLINFLRGGIVWYGIVLDIPNTTEFTGSDADRIRVLLLSVRTASIRMGRGGGKIDRPDK